MKEMKKVLYDYTKIKTLPSAEHSRGAGQHIKSSLIIPLFIFQNYFSGFLFIPESLQLQSLPDIIPAFHSRDLLVNNTSKCHSVLYSVT